MENLITYSKTSPISDEKFDRLFEILEYSFPPCERGSYALHRSEFTRDEFRCMCYEPEGVPAAFINYYHLRDINALFVEHFASAEELRGKGIGSAVMNSLLERSGDSLVVLEVEPPEDELSRRRVQLYRRLGFTLNDGSYFQPPFYGNPKPLPLMLMSTRPLSASEFASTAASIHRNVYKA